MRQPQPARAQPADGEHAIALQHQWHGDQHDDERLSHQGGGLQAEQQHHGGDETRYGRGLEPGGEGADRQLRPPLQHGARGHAGQQRQHYVEHGGQQQGGPRHREFGHPQQEGGDGREGHHHDEVVDRDLHERVVRVPPNQLAPDEYHGGAGGHTQQDHPGDVLLRIRRRHPSRKHELEEEHPEPRHGEGLDQPVHHQGQRQALRASAHLAHATPVDLDHHRVDHDPDEHGYHQVDVRHFQCRHGLEQAGDGEPEGDPGPDAQGHPQGEEAFEQSHGASRCRRSALADLAHLLLQ